MAIKMHLTMQYRSPLHQHSEKKVHQGIKQYGQSKGSERETIHIVPKWCPFLFFRIETMQVCWDLFYIFLSQLAPPPPPPTPPPPPPGGIVPLRTSYFLMLSTIQFWVIILTFWGEMPPQSAASFIPNCSRKKAYIPHKGPDGTIMALDIFCKDSFSFKTLIFRYN